MDKDTKIRAVMILDIIGRPPEHLVENLERIAGEIDNEKDVVVKSKSIKEPILMKDRKDFYTTFAEIEVEVENMLTLALLLFRYMPAHFEIIEPEMLVLSNNGWNEIFNELARRLHSYDEIARVLQVEKEIFIKKTEELSGKPIQEVFARQGAQTQPKEKKKPSKKPKSKGKKKK
jgi:hypothetical protein